ncbi:DUF3848 domain-containing protein [Anaerosolibacter sp.]|uniref:DUF3848 domain-containing protein n=1 Tax=Anaerosolibacter sp. TaxID=1872527 RepID=UPI0039EF365B
MNKKLVLLQKMDQELSIISAGDYDLRSGEGYMTVQSVHNSLRNWFSVVEFDETILQIMLEKKEPLEDMYDFYVDSGYLINAVDGMAFCQEYARYLEQEHLSELINEKIQDEYNQFLEGLKIRPPLDVPKLSSEFTLKTDVLGLFRYDHCFNSKELKLLHGIPNLLDKIYEKSASKTTTATDMNEVGKIVIESVVLIMAEYKVHVEVEDEELEV